MSAHHVTAARPTATQKFKLPAGSPLGYLLALLAKPQAGTGYRITHLFREEAGLDQLHYAASVPEALDCHHQDAYLRVYNTRCSLMFVRDPLTGFVRLGPFFREDFREGVSLTQELQEILDKEQPNLRHTEQLAESLAEVLDREIGSRSGQTLNCLHKMHQADCLRAIGY